MDCLSSLSSNGRSARAAQVRPVQPVQDAHAQPVQDAHAGPARVKPRHRAGPRLAQLDLAGSDAVPCPRGIGAQPALEQTGPRMVLE